MWRSKRNRALSEALLAVSEPYIKRLGGALLRHVPPDYKRELTLEENWRNYFHWALELKDPARAIPEHGIRAAVHPLGFTAVYLTLPMETDSLSPSLKALIRANIVPAGVRDDVHSHGYHFYSGVVEGEITNSLYPDIMQHARLAEPGEPGYIGYKSEPDVYGVNHVRLATRPLILPVPEQTVLTVEDSYAMGPYHDAHSLCTEDRPVTVFGKIAPRSYAQYNTMHYETTLECSYLFRPETEPPPPAEY